MLTLCVGWLGSQLYRCNAVYAIVTLLRQYANWLICSLPSNDSSKIAAIAGGCNSFRNNELAEPLGADAYTVCEKGSPAALFWFSIDVCHLCFIAGALWHTILIGTDGLGSAPQTKLSPKVCLLKAHRVYQKHKNLFNMGLFFNLFFSWCSSKELRS